MSSEWLSEAFQVERLRERWAACELHPNSVLDHFLLVSRLAPGVERPLVWIDNGEDRTCAWAAARLERTHLPLRIGYLPLDHVPVRLLRVIMGGYLGAWDVERAGRFVDACDAILRDDRADAVEFRCLTEVSPLWTALAHRARTCGVRAPAWNRHWELTLDGEPGFLLNRMRSKHRAWIRRKTRELEDAFPQRMQWRWHAPRDGVRLLCDQLETVAATTYQRGLEAGFVNNALTRARLDLWARRGELRVLVLDLDGVPQAFWIGILLHGSFHSSATGYRPELRAFEVGTLMFLRMVDELIREGARKIDFGQGDAQYKQRFGDHSWREANALLVAPSWRGRSACAATALAAAGERAARRLAERMGAADRIKQRWRDRLRRRTDARDAEAQAPV